jgi:universal stress protein A
MANILTAAIRIICASGQGWQWLVNWLPRDSFQGDRGGQWGSFPADLKIPRLLALENGQIRRNWSDRGNRRQGAPGTTRALDHGDRAIAGIPPEDTMIAIKNILVATDFSEPSGVAMAYGRDLARNHHARLHVLHTVEDAGLRASMDGGLLGDLQGQLEQNARRDLKALIRDEDRTAHNAVGVIRRGVNPADTIAAYARANSIDLIVTGTHGRGGIQHLLMGSVAERIVRTAPCPVLTVRAHERDFIVPDAIALEMSV